ncbi:WXG100 family type VII secretion target [Actinosynnema sp. NPDC059335]|uniref:WXG100 family type VII secretion target n=1 Tax=Actinosynnema sp. NPDC059335 TaxID=3346804 RepID=UPI003672E9C9
MPGLTTTSSGPGLGRADELHEINESVRRNDWAHPDSVVLPGGTAALGDAPDPVDALSNTGIPGLLDQLQPLRDAQRWFAGDPAAVTGYVEKWQRVAELAREAGDAFDASLRRHTAHWTGDAGARYREEATTIQQDYLDVVVRAAESIVALVTAAGDMTGSSRAEIQESVRLCVNDVINRLPDYYNVLNSGHPAALNHVLADVAAIVDSWA